jgi:glutamate synthase (NADPH/NADH) small chain
VTVYEKRSLLGGLLTHANAPYKQLIDPLPAEALAIEEAGVEFKMGVSVGEEPSIEEIEAKHDAIFLGIGLGGDIEVNWEGKDLQGVYNSLEFIERLKLKGDVEVGDCVAVIGGGNTAIDAARESIRLGARDVFILYRRTEREMPAYPHEVEEAKEEGVRFYWLTAPKRFVGNSRVEGIECVYMRLGEPDSSGRRRPQEVKGTEFMMEADTVILALGQQRRTDFLSKIKGLELEGGLVKVNENFQTANPKYFAGGDCVNGGDTVVKAVSHGVKAALGIDLYLR